MPRSARLDIPDLLQHVMVRGIEQCDIFRSNEDRRRFVERLSGLLTLCFFGFGMMYPVSHTDC